MTPQSERAPLLDVCRAAAVLLVTGHHNPAPAPSGSFGETFFNAWERIGWLGVDLFFVISGFLIGRQLIKEVQGTGSLRLRRFWFKRAGKIWPPYFVFLFAAVAYFFTISTATDPVFETWVGFWPNLFHVQNYFGTAVGHTWSLAVEEHFYVFLPLLLVAIASPAKRSPWVMPAVAALICLGVLAVRFASVRGPFDLLRNHAPTHLRFDSLFVGVLVAWATETYAERLKKLSALWPAFIALGVALLVPFAIWDHEPRPLMFTAGYSLIAVAGACIVFASWLGDATRTAKPWLITRVFATVGMWSYSIYLWQRPFADVVAKKLAPSLGSHAALMPCFTAVSIAFGVLGYFLVERPSLKFRDRLLAGTGKPSALSAQRL